jgi:aspartate-semialdehyde dehydrogenase
VGKTFLQIAAERSFPVKSLKLLATERSAGKRLPFGESEIVVEKSSRDAIKGADFVFISATDEASREFGTWSRELGALAIDDSSVWRQDADVPLIIPEVNADDLAGHRNIVAIPNCTTTPLVMCLAPLHRVNPVKRVVAATYQAVSGTGTAAMTELDAQSRAWAKDAEVATPEVYPKQIAFNVLPHAGSFRDDGYTSEEWKMVAETRKIMHAPDLPLSTTCARVPVFYSHSVAAHIEFAQPMKASDARAILRDAPGVVVQDDPAGKVYPTPLDASHRDAVFVGRIREDTSVANGIALWTTTDNIRKGAALNAIQIAEAMIDRGLV